MNGYTIMAESYKTLIEQGKISKVAVENAGIDEKQAKEVLANG